MLLLRPHWTATKRPGLYIFCPFCYLLTMACSARAPKKAPIRTRLHLLRVLSPGPAPTSHKPPRPGPTSNSLAAVNLAMFVTPLDGPVRGPWFGLILTPWHSRWGWTTTMGRLLRRGWPGHLDRAGFGRVPGWHDGLDTPSEIHVAGQ